MTPGPVSRLAATLRRRRRDRAPRVVVYDAAGHSRVLDPSADSHVRVLAVAERMIAIGGRRRASVEADAAPAEDD